MRSLAPTHDGSEARANSEHTRRMFMRITKLTGLGLSIASLLTMLPSQSRALDKKYSKLPMSFERNVAQSGAGVDFIARGSGYSVLLGPGGAMLALKQRTLDRTSEAFTKHNARTAT